MGAFEKRILIKMNLLSKFKRTVGLESKPKGNVLGGNEVDKTEKNKNVGEYDVVFNQEKLGFQVFEGQRDGKTYVNGVNEGDFAYDSGVRNGDVIVSLDGNKVMSHENFLAIVTALGRPLTVR